MSPSQVRLYWSCGGEVMALGGAASLATSDGRPSLGCGPISLQRAADLQAFYACEAVGCADLAARRHCLACAGQLRDAICSAGQWARAA